MATYTNAGSFQPNMDFRTNPLQGMVAGQQMSAMQQLLDRDYRDSDQGYLSTLNTYQNELADNPVKEATRQGKLADMNIDQQMRDSGLVLGQRTADAQAKISKDQTSMQSDQVEQFQRKGEFINHLSQELTANPYKANESPYRWQGYVEDAKKQGINLPDNYTPELENAIHAKAQAYQKNVPYLQKMSEIRETGSQQRQNTVLNNASAANVAKIQGVYRLQELAAAPGRSVEEAYRDMASGTANAGQKKIIALDLAKKLYGPSINSTASKMGGLDGSDAQNAVIQKLLGTLLDDEKSAATGGNGALSADDQAKVDKVANAPANKGVSREAIIKDMKAKKLIGP